MAPGKCGLSLRWGSWGGQEQLAPRVGTTSFLGVGVEDRKHKRDRGVVREVERKARELGGQEGGGRWLEREARRPEGPRRGKKPGGWTLHGVRGESA